jgi:hypothetical protein
VRDFTLEQSVFEETDRVSAGAEQAAVVSVSASE